MISLFGFLLIFLIFITVCISTQGKLDRLSYSLVGILRERTVLYPPHQPLSSADVEELYAVAKIILHDMHINGDLSNLSIKAEELVFRGDKEANNTLVNRTSLATGSAIAEYRFFRAGKKNNNCEAPARLDTLGTLSPDNNLYGKQPLYQVTLCYQIGMSNTFNKLGNITAYAIAVAR
ncbi:Flp pilus assembly protein (plasmid) [Sodalis praecaptivus]|uniref:Flp pilus assembly protein n=1 Tax=Sodalis praecaptivus TaxID=1239307 RepID=W0HZA2_9GAMM|nr:tight adherence pilus pseudopilin TadF [Sodalis praecaptivus]AHF79104.1 Flp pilus assembly protein [Sodalis praecaptivus]